MGRKRKHPLSDVGWDTPGGRVRWLLMNLWKDNRLAMAQGVGVSHAVINKVASKQQEPGRRLLAAIASHPKVNPAWLLTGQGTPLLQPADDPAAKRAVRVATRMLPGSPQQYADLLSEEAVDPARLFLASQYWLRLQRDQPILEDLERGFLVGDLLLMESDRKLFPRKERLDNQLCVVRVPHPHPGQESTLKLGLVTHYGASQDDPEWMDVDTFDLGVPSERMVKRLIVDTYPGKKYHVVEQDLELVKVHGQERAVELSDFDPLFKPRITYADVVAVWTHFLHRPDNAFLG